MALEDFMIPIPAAADAAPPLYSARAIRTFSMLFSAVAGGTLMAQNLKVLGQPGAARKALWGSIAYTAAMSWLLRVLPLGSRSGVFLVAMGYIGAMMLEKYAKPFIPEHKQFPDKSIIKPLLICLAIVIPIIAFVIYATIHPEALDAVSR